MDSMKTLMVFVFIYLQQSHLVMISNSNETFTGQAIMLVTDNCPTSAYTNVTRALLILTEMQLILKQIINEHQQNDICSAKHSVSLNAHHVRSECILHVSMNHGFYNV